MTAVKGGTVGSRQRSARDLDGKGTSVRRPAVGLPGGVWRPRPTLTCGRASGRRLETRAQP